MTAFTPAMDAALRADGAIWFHAVEVILPGGALRLLDGAGQLSFAGRTFLGDHPTFGVLADIDGLDYGADAQASELVLRFTPPSGADAATLASPASQGSLVTVWQGVIDPVSSAVIPDPKVIFQGRLDVPTLSGDRSALALEFTVVAETEALFEGDEGVRLSYAFHQSIYPGDEALAFVTGVQDQMPWGAEARIPAAITAGVTPAAAGGAGGRSSEFLGLLQ